MATVTFNWNLPTTVGGGKAVPAGDNIASVNVYTQPGSVLLKNFPGAVTTGQADMSPGQYVCTIAVVDSQGTVGSQGNGFVVTVPNPGPPPPFDPPTNPGYSVG